MFENLKLAHPIRYKTAQEFAVVINKNMFVKKLNNRYSIDLIKKLYSILC